MTNNEEYSTLPPYAGFGDDVRRDYGPKGCAGIVLGAAGFAVLVVVLAVAKTLGWVQ